MAKLIEVGFDAAEVEKAVRANSYSHEAACYEMLYTAAQGEQSARLSARHSDDGEKPGLGNFFPFNLA